MQILTIEDEPELDSWCMLLDSMCYQKLSATPTSTSRLATGLPTCAE
ncbi:hypothetical protein C7378_0898 [Acidipila rosea]|uniref:Uncharacterized protein n=1 Tax=Acidipila rosea TaxID=768535 RepID=A0A4R1LGR4_9BACT|nr:hypothetical protein C7378_0898 [Acidipila rosea]